MSDETREAAPPKGEREGEDREPRRGVLRIETGTLRVPEGLDTSKSAAGSGRVVAVIALLALLFAAFIAWLIHGGQ